MGLPLFPGSASFDPFTGMGNRRAVIKRHNLSNLDGVIHQIILAEILSEWGCGFCLHKLTGQHKGKRFTIGAVIAVYAGL